MPIIKIPVWKAYLYSLHARIKLYRLINTNQLRLGLDRKEVALFNNLLKTFIPKGGEHYNRARKYDLAIRNVFKHMTDANEQQLELAIKLSWITKLNTEDLIMEMKQLKEFAKEVGLKPAQIGKLNEEQLTIAIMKAIDPANEYPQEFIEWYENLDDKFYDIVEAGAEDTTATDESGEALSDYSELLEVIESTDDLAQLKEIADDADFAEVFKGITALTKRNAAKLKAAMIEKVSALVPAQTSDDDAPVEGGAIEIDDETKAILIETIQSIEDEESMVEMLSDDDILIIFDGHIDIGETIDVEAMKIQMLNALGYETPAVEATPAKPQTLAEKMKAKRDAAAAEAAATKAAKAAPKPAETPVIEFDPNEFDPETVYEMAEKLGIPQLRKFAKQLGVTASAGSNKDAILEMVANKLQEMAEASGINIEANAEGEAEITAELISEAIKANDTDTLVAVADALGVTFNALQKKSAKLMGAKLLDSLPEEKVAEEVKAEPKKGGKRSQLKSTTKDAPVGEQASVYQIIESMVIAGKSADDIVKEVRPIYESRGKALLFIKKRVAQLIEIVQIDNNLK